MDAKINNIIRSIFMLHEKDIPPMLDKHLTNKMFNKQNKEAMEQVLYYLLLLTDLNCFKTVSWPITSFKEAAEFRNAATKIINNLSGFVYEKSPNIFGKVNSSLLSNPGGLIFINFMYQLCLYILTCELKKKNINFLNTPLYVEDNDIDKKYLFFNGITKSNFNEVNEIISRLDNNIKNTTELSIKYKEIIQDSKQTIKDFKSELLNIEHCEATECEVAELKQKYIHLYDKFEQDKLIAMKCTGLADIILRTPETWDANIINIYNEKLIGIDGNVDLLKLLTTIKNNLNGCINWCDRLNDDEKINYKILEAKQSVIDMIEQKECYEKLLNDQNNMIEYLQSSNKKLKNEIFTSKSFENMDPRLKILHTRSPPIILKPDSIENPKSITTENIKKSRRQSFLLHCSDTPYTYQTMSFDEIKVIYQATLPNQNKVDDQDDKYEDNRGNSSTLNEFNQTTENFQDKTNITLKDYLSSTFHHAENIETNSNETQIKEDEVKSVSISRRSLENIKKQFIRIKQGQTMSTIPHSPQSPF